MTPADSEHSAIFQCLQGVPPGGMRRVILTASGGAFRDYETAELLRLCKEDPEVGTLVGWRYVGRLAVVGTSVTLARWVR